MIRAAQLLLEEQREQVFEVPKEKKMKSTRSCLQMPNSQSGLTFNSRQGWPWQRSKTSHWVSLTLLLLTVASLFELVLGVWWKVNSRRGRSLGPEAATGCSPHTSFRGQRWAHGFLPSEESSLCFASVSRRLMNRLLATVGLCVWRLW